MLTEPDYVGLREDVSQLAELPDLAAIHRRGRNRRRMRRAAPVVAVVAVVAVLLGVTQLAAPLSRGGVEQLPAGPALDMPAAVTGPLAGTSVSVSQRLELRSIETVDQLRSFALVTTGDRRDALARTLDGGRSWQAWLLPARPRTAVERPIWLGGQTVTINGLISRDGGQTWAGVPAGVGAEVEALPDGWVVRAEGGKVVAVDPTTGQVHPLASQPPLGLGGYSPVVRQASDGSLWTLVAEPDTHLPGMGGTPRAIGQPAVSRDAGRTWRVDSVGSPGSDVMVAGIDSADGRTGYAVGARAAGDHLVSVVYVTTDGGQSWRLTGGGSITAPKYRSIFDQPAVLPNGDLLVTAFPQPTPGGPTTVRRSVDGGRTLVPVSVHGDVVTVRRSATGVLVGTVTEGPPTGSMSPVGRLLSVDGVHWTRGPEPPDVFRVPGHGTRDFWSITGDYTN